MLHCTRLWWMDGCSHVWPVAIGHGASEQRKTDSPADQTLAPRWNLNRGRRKKATKKDERKKGKGKKTPPPRIRATAGYSTLVRIRVRHMPILLATDGPVSTVLYEIAHIQYDTARVTRDNRIFCNVAEGPYLRNSQAFFSPTCSIEKRPWAVLDGAFN